MCPAWPAMVDIGIPATESLLAEAIKFAAERRVRSRSRGAPRDINRVLSELMAGKIDGRIVLGWT
jgi:D-arabinose 1-dehydrogenase-like Zn-dependent alcohol dehydrogenase